MTVTARTLAGPLLVAAALACGSCFAGLDEGLAALARRDYAAAAKELRPLAERGNAEAQYRVGLMYEFGAGYPKDVAQAVVWLTRAANQGHVAAQQELGVVYTTGDGVAKDDARAVAWFRKAANAGNPAAQYNLGLMLAKGAGAQLDYDEALAWFRKAAAQGFAAAQFKVGVAYEHGAGVAPDPVLAYANYAIAARDGNAERVAQRDALAKRLSPAQAQRGQALAAAWTVGQPMPGSSAVATAATPPARDRCSAVGQLGGEKFSATHCAVAYLGDQNSVALWFNEEAISPQEAEAFQASSYADGAKGGKPRTTVTVMFCPGGGKPAAAPAAVRQIDLNTNHARSPLAGVQWLLEAPRDFRVEKLAGDVRPGGTLSGRISARRDGTAFTLDFDVTLPQKEAAAGLACGK